MIRAYCHKVIKLSGVLQSYAPEKESVENVHGVREDFIYEGRRRGQHFLEKKHLLLDEEVEGQVYYIGKLLWAKGFEQMLELEEFYRECTGKYFAVDVYGGGPEEDEIKRAFLGRQQRNKRIETEEAESDSEDQAAVGPDGYPATCFSPTELKADYGLPPKRAKSTEEQLYHVTSQSAALS